MIVKNVVPNKLHQELVDAGVECSVSHNLEDGRYFVGDCEIKFADNTDMSAVQAVIDAHNPAPLLPQPTEFDYLIDLDFRLSMIELGL